MNAARILVAGMALAGLGVGWISASPVATDAEDRDDPAIVQVRHGSERAAQAAARIAALPIAAPPMMEAEEAYEPPPPPDIAVLFRRDLTAIETEGRRPALWVVDLTAPSLRRRIGVGQVYQDGWVVSAIGDQTVQLRKRRETRNVAVFEAPVYDNP